MSKGTTQDVVVVQYQALLSSAETGLDEQQLLGQQIEQVKVLRLIDTGLCLRN